MSFWSAIVLIVLIGAAASVIRTRYSSQHGLSERESEGSAHSLTRPSEHEARRDGDAEREIETLKERIAVLERIAYDKNSTSARERARIDAEIEALRDERD